MAVVAAAAVVAATAAAAAATAAVGTTATASTAATAAAPAVRADAESPVPPACAGGTTPDAKVCVTVDVHVESAVGGGGAGELTRFDVEDALESVLTAIAADTGLEPAGDIGLVVDTPPEEQLGGVFYTLFLRVPPNVTDDAADAVAAAAVRGFGAGVSAAVPKAGAVVVLGPASVIGTRVAPVAAEEEGVGEGEGGEAAEASASPPEATAGGDDGGATTGTSMGDGDGADSDSDSGDDDGGGGGLSGGALAGTVVGALALAAVAVAVSIIIVRRRAV